MKIDGLVMVVIGMIIFFGLIIFSTVVQMGDIQNKHEIQTETARNYVIKALHDDNNLSIFDKTKLITQSCDIYVSIGSQECRQELVEEFIGKKNSHKEASE